jgi:hypothetical protein
MRTVVAVTLQQSLVFRPGDEGRVLPPHPYEDFARVIAEVQATDYSGVSVISFNYDLAADYAFHFVGIPIDYGLPTTGRFAVRWPSASCMGP